MSKLTKISIGCGVLAAILGTIATVTTGEWMWMAIGLSSMAMGALRLWTENQLGGKR